MIQWEATGAPAFVDTNVFAYALDKADAEKQRKAQHLIDAHSANLVISTQVLLELFAVCTRKLAMSRDDAAAAVRGASELSVVPADRNLMLDAVALAASDQISVFDAAILSAASRAGCGQIFTEDLAEGPRYNGVTVVNPFR